MGERTSGSPAGRPLSWSLRTTLARRSLARRSSNPASNHASYSGRDSCAIRDASSCSLRPSSSSRLISADSAGSRSSTLRASVPSNTQVRPASTSASSIASTLCARGNATPRRTKMARAPTPTGPSLVPLYPGPAPRLLRGEGPHVNPGLTAPPTIETEDLNRNRVKSRLLPGENLQTRSVRERLARLIVRRRLHRYLSRT